MRAKAIVAALGDAAERWRTADFPPRVRATARVIERTGYSQPVVEYALDRLFCSITGDALEAAIRDELGSLEILDGFTSRPGRPDAWAAPAGEVCIISSRTTIGVALAPALFALCAKCRVLVKDREDALIANFFETVFEERDELREYARAEYWIAGEAPEPDLRGFDTVVAFGRNQTLQAIRSSLNSGARFIPYARRASAGYVSREALGRESSARAIAQAAARDVVLYETEGCLSLHVLFVESGGTVSPSDFLDLFDREVRHLEIQFPRGRVAPVTAALAAQEAALAGFRAAAGVAYALEKPPPFLPRTAATIVVEGPQAALEYVRRHDLPLEAFALANARGDVVAAAMAAGAVRLAPFGTLQDPPLEGNHGGRARIADFVKWVERTI